MFVVISLFALQKLTEEQAARLKKAQEERNREEGKADEEVADGEEDDEQPVSESQAHGNGNDYSDYIVSGDLKKRPRAQNNNVIMVMDIFRNI